MRVDLGCELFHLCELPQRHFSPAVGGQLFAEGEVGAQLFVGEDGGGVAMGYPFLPLTLRVWTP